MGLFSSLKQKIQSIQEELERSQQQYQAALYPKTFKLSKLEDIIFSDSTIEPIGPIPLLKDVFPFERVDTTLDLVSDLKTLFGGGKFDDSSIRISSIDSRGILPIGIPVPISEIAEENIVAILGEKAFQAMDESDTTLGFYSSGALFDPEHKKVLADSGIDIAQHPTATSLIAIRDKIAKYDYELIQAIGEGGQKSSIPAPLDAFSTVAHELTHAASSFEYKRSQSFADALLLHQIGNLRHHISTAAPGSMTFDDPVVVNAMDAARFVMNQHAVEEVTAQVGSIAFAERAGIPLSRSIILTGYHSPSSFGPYSEGPLGLLSEQVVEMVKRGLIRKPDGSLYTPEDSAFFTSHIAQELQMQGASVYNAGMLRSLAQARRPRYGIHPRGCRPRHAREGRHPH